MDASFTEYEFFKILVVLGIIFQCQQST